MSDVIMTGPVAGLPASAVDCLARARGLIPLLQSAAARIDAAHELPKDVLDGMHDAGMFRLLIPRAFGGFELKPSEYVRCVEAIAIGDASAAWCMNQGSGCSMTAAYLAPEVSWEVWGGKRDVLAWGRGLRRRRSELTGAGAALATGALPPVRATRRGWGRCVRVFMPMVRRCCTPTACHGTARWCSAANLPGLTMSGR
jgi:alkylation response protein AidB-like acyl-CoA dehydrogenase